MTTTKPSAGDRFILRQDVDRYPHFVAMRGMTGTVKEVLDDGAIIGIMDQPIQGAEEWSNEVWWLAGEPDFLEDTSPIRD
jgi:hypothetical protein